MIYEEIISRVPVNKGWSGDQKYRVTVTDGSVYLLRIAPLERLQRREHAFTHMQQAAKLKIPMCEPVEFGVCEEGVYTLETFIEGSDGEDYIGALSSIQQYAYGLDAGAALKKLHSLPAPADAQDWESRFNGKIDRKLSAYEGCPLKYENDEPMLRYLAENRHLLKDRPQSYQHGDFHIGNMMVDTSGKLVIIDFDKDDHGDPWEEFNRLVWCAQAAPAFASGMVDGYFDANVPQEFWKLLALYICSNCISSLPWAIPFGEEEIQIMRRQQADILTWYENMTRVIPSWYQPVKDGREYENY